MRHRHIETTEWTLAAIDSCLDRGDLSEWRDLFRGAGKDKRIAERIAKLARWRNDPSGALALALVRRRHPEVNESQYPVGPSQDDWLL